MAPAPELPIPESAVVIAADISQAPRRTPVLAPPRIRVGPYEYGCNECHGLFVSAPERQGRLFQHAHIELDHGLNTRCFNCHDRSDREKLVLRDGSLVSFDRVPTLCSQCHGTTFRDWERGMHGKDVGSWDRGSPSWRRFGCAECHDPHHPAYPRYVPLPGPNTMRMGEQGGDSQHREGPSENPLNPWWSWEHPEGVGGRSKPEEVPQSAAERILLKSPGPVVPEPGGGH